MTQDSNSIILSWFSAMSRSVHHRDIQAHMAQVSEKVHVFGIPGSREITFLDWEQRRRNEFDNDLIEDISYHLERVVSITPRRISFKAEETMRATSGQVIILNKDITLELNPANELWQVVEENIRNWQIQ